MTRYCKSSRVFVHVSSFCCSKLWDMPLSTQALPTSPSRNGCFPCDLQCDQNPSQRKARTADQPKAQHVVLRCTQCQNPLWSGNTQVNRTIPNLKTWRVLPEKSTGTGTMKKTKMAPKKGLRDAEPPQTRALQRRQLLYNLGGGSVAQERPPGLHPVRPRPMHCHATLVKTKTRYPIVSVHDLDPIIVIPLGRGEWSPSRRLLLPPSMSSEGGQDELECEGTLALTCGLSFAVWSCSNHEGIAKTKKVPHPRGPITAQGVSQRAEVNSCE